MRFRSCYIPTLKETPADAEVISQKLLIRAGMIRKLTSGVYTYMPLALRSLRKIEKIIREEMDRVDFVELLLAICGRNPAAGSITAVSFCASRTATTGITALARRTRK